MKDSIGQEIQPGNICSHASRYSSSMYFEILIVEELLEGDKVRGTKVIQGWFNKEWKRRRSKEIMAKHLTVTGLTEEKLAGIIREGSGVRVEE